MAQDVRLAWSIGATMDGKIVRSQSCVSLPDVQKQKCDAEK